MCFLSHEEFFFFELPTEIIRNKLFSYDPWPGQPIKLKNCCLLSKKYHFVSGSLSNLIKKIWN